MPNCSTRGTTAAADAPPNSREDINAGRTLYEANSVGNEDADSFNVLYQNQYAINWKENKANLSRDVFSASLARL